MRFILADPYLTDLSGHCFSYLESLRVELNRRGETSILIGSEMLDQQLQALGAMKGFSHLSGKSPSPRSLGEKLTALIRRPVGPLIGDLSRLNSELKLGLDDLLVINSLRPQHLPDFAEWLTKLSPDQRPWILLILHFTSSPEGKPKKRLVQAYRDGFAQLRQSQAGNRVLLAADTQELVDEISPLAKLPILLAPIPHVSARSFQPSPPPVQLHISFMGQARPDKGFDLLPDLARGLSHDLKSGLIKFTVQSFTPAYLGDRYCGAIEALRAYGCRILDNILDESEYNCLLLDSDIILLPYSGESYRRQSSGILAEAISAGKVVIAPSGTWMGEQIAKTGAGLAYDAYDPDGLQKALHQALATYPDLAARAQIAATKWCAFHNAANLLAILESERQRRIEAKKRP